jgi:hypothetical protein
VALLRPSRSIGSEPVKDKSLEPGSVVWTAKSWSHLETRRVFAHVQGLADALGEDSKLMTVFHLTPTSPLGRRRHRQQGPLFDGHCSAASLIRTLPSPSPRQPP